VRGTEFACEWERQDEIKEVFMKHGRLGFYTIACLSLAVSVVTLLITIQPSLSEAKPRAKPAESTGDATAVSATSAMTPPMALRIIRERLQKGIRGDHGIFGSGCDITYQNINATFTQLSYTRVEVCENSRYASAPQSVSLQFNNPSDWQSFHKLGSALGFTNAVNAIKYYSSGSDVTDDLPMFAKFKEEAAAWRALPVKPALPDDAQRFRIVAEDAFKNKDFEKAVEYYERGLTIEPLWPQGQYNAALLYGELQIYGQAAVHMKRYLALVPDAPNATPAWEKMYLWEEKAKEAGEGMDRRPRINRRDAQTDEGDTQTR
jgi:hypothetical protein